MRLTVGPSSGRSMPQECSFDIVSKIELQEVDNAVQQTMKEIRTRYDFKGSVSDVTRSGNELTIVADDRFRLKSVVEILNQKLAKRAVPLKAIHFREPRESAGDTVTQIVDLQEGIGTEQARELVRLIKEMKSKVQASIMGDQLRVKGRSRDDLQTVMAHLREKNLDFDIQFTNYRS
jgi:uncharacterized protein YajQ (UPF0234 family)